MSFSSEVKKEIKQKYFSLKNRHSGVRSKKDAGKEIIIESFQRSGTVSDPKKNYHLEIICSSEKEAGDIISALNSFEIYPKKGIRKQQIIVYLKDSENISNLLALMGANSAVLELENEIILKEMRENIQRKVNCETANINKTVSASVKQIEDIELINKKIGIDTLPDQLRSAALARLSFPDATLAELADSIGEGITKSGVNHRLRKLSEIANAIK